MKYDDDLYQWTIEQAAALRSRALDALDYDNLAEEIESVGKRARREIESRLEKLIVRLLKWHYQPGRRCGSWEASIVEARHRIELILADSLSLRSRPKEVLGSAYQRAILDKTVRRLELLPEDCPWTIEQVRGDWLPE